MNVDKTKILEIGKTYHKIKTVVEGKSVEKVENFKYLIVKLNSSRH